MEFDKPQYAQLRKYTGPVANVKVLVVDANSACRAVISKSLLSLGYEVATATLASEALSVIGEKKNEINVVLVEAQLPDMEVYELIDKMKSSSIPSFITTAYDDDIPSITKALHTGAIWCFRKPVQISDLQQLWRFAVWNRYEPTLSEEVLDYWWPLSEVVTNGLEWQPSLNTREQSVESVNGKAQESFDKETTVLLKTKRRTWTDDINRKFLDAVQTAGIDAPLKTIFELMDVEGLKKDHVSKYLQKYRQSMNLHANPMEQHVNGQGVTKNPAFNQKDLNMSDPFFPALPISRLPPEENVKINEVFNAKESQMFTDDDLKMWLSTIPGTFSSCSYY
ncbi:hypothetical protein P8452_69311 [Trifolium repens]|nr:hypothetical protein P8452_69311 [Trifolium repens]